MVETRDSEADRAPPDVDYSPSRVSGALSTAAGAVAVLTSAPFQTLAVPLGVGGLAALVAGLFVRDSRRLISAGVVGILAGVLVAGVFGLAAPLVLAGAVAALVAWDVGQNAVSTGRQLTTTADTHRSELVHATASTVVGTAVAGVAYGVYWIASGGRPVTALLLMLAGGVILTWALRA